jgi:fructose-1,6-bisphosphatase I
MRIPEDGTIYSINEGNLLSCSAGVQAYIQWCKETDKATQRPYSARYIGSLVADFHRNLIKGGIYMYPGTVKNKDGKLRLQYESNPLAFIVEQAGGKASDGKGRIMDIQPSSLHQRAPLFIGSKNMVELVERLIAEENN